MPRSGWFGWIQEHAQLVGAVTVWVVIAGVGIGALVAYASSQDHNPSSPATVGPPSGGGGGVAVGGKGSGKLGKTGKVKGGKKGGGKGGRGREEAVRWWVGWSNPTDRTGGRGQLPADAAYGQRPARDRDLGHGDQDRHHDHRVGPAPPAVPTPLRRTLGFRESSERLRRHLSPPARNRQGGRHTTGLERAALRAARPAGIRVRGELVAVRDTVVPDHPALQSDHE